MSTLDVDLLARLQTGPTLFACEIASGSPTATELAGRMGFDALVIDARHAAVSVYSGELESLIRAADAAAAPALVRIGDSTPGTINRAMNDGAAGLLVAADDPQVALRASRAMRYPPKGFRGAAPVVRAARLGLTPWEDYLATTNEARPLGICIETAAGVDAAAAIAEVDGVDLVVFDLFALCLAGDPAVEASVVRARMGEIRAGGTPVGVSLIEPASITEWSDDSSFVLVGTELAAYVQATTDLRRSLDAVPTSLASAPAGGAS